VRCTAVNDLDSGLRRNDVVVFRPERKIFDFA
jgi:hypothetical protein